MPGSLTPAVAPGQQWPTTGREQDLAAAEAVLARDARVVAVHGPRGVGKSRFLAELGERLGAGNVHVVQLGGSAILSVVPLGALSSHLPGLTPYDGTTVDPARLFGDAASALTAESAGRPSVLLVDDVSLLDSVSLLLVAQLAAAGRLRLVASVRHGDPLPEPLVATWNTARDLRLDLDALDADATRTLLEAVLGGPVAHRTATSLHTDSGGNPLYLRELVLGALAAGTLDAAHGVWQLSGAPSATPTLRELVLSRIAQHGPAGRDALERIAVCGPLRLAQLPGDGVRTALATLETSGLVRIDGDTVTLAQPVYATVLTQSMSRLRVEDVLAEQAARLAAEAGGSPDLLQVTLWQLEAGLPSDPEVVLTATRIAAGSGDHDTVLRLAEAGLRTAPDHPDLLFLQADALLRTGRADEALAALHRHPGDERIARLVVVAHLTGRGPLAALEALRDADADAGAGAGTPDLALELTRAGALVAAGRAADAERVVAALAPVLGESEQARARLAQARAVALACQGRDEEALAAARTAVDFAEATDGAVIGLCRTETGLGLATVQHLLGQYGDARRSAVLALAEAAGTGDEILSRSIEFLLGRIALDAGHLGPAERWLTETISGATSVGPPAIAALARLSLTATYGATGAVEQARETLAEIPEDLVPASWIGIARAWAEGDVDATLLHVERAARDALDAGNVMQAVAAWQVALDLDRAEVAVAPLRAMATACQSTLVSLMADHAAAAADGDHVRLLQLADTWEGRDALRLAAAACASAARAQHGARTSASARARADELVRRCDGLDVPVVRAGEGTSPLTPREREIATLAAAGAASKEIAAQLYLSSRTVDNHLQSVYTKLGVTGRASLRTLGVR